MEIRASAWISCGLLGTFLLLSSLPLSFSLSADSTHKTVHQQFLIPHNILRSKLGLPPLKWSNKLASFASQWAHQRQEDCELRHSGSEYGENLFWGSGKNWKPRDAVDVWGSERSYYNYKTNSCTHNRDCLHYTQIIWRQSTKVGCARVVCKSGDTFIICNYFPHGNVIGQKPF